MFFFLTAKNIIEQKAENHKKIMQKLFNDKRLQIIKKRNLKIVDYLNVTWNLCDGT